MDRPSAERTRSAQDMCASPPAGVIAAASVPRSHSSSRMQCAVASEAKATMPMMLGCRKRLNT